VLSSEHNRKVREKRKRRKSIGQCILCESMAIPGRSRCHLCAEKHREQMREWHRNNREESRARRKERRKKLILDNRCPMCGVDLDYDSDLENLNCINCRGRNGIKKIGGYPK
jgi:hypothetical protein